jgi:tetratricopeptide (TPR) repeat protein
MGLHKIMRASFVIALCSAAAPSLWADCAGPPALAAKIHARATADNYVELGIWFGDHHNYDCAIKNFEAALKLEPESARTSYLIGLSYYFSGQSEAAVSPLENSIRLNPKNLDSRLILAGALSRLGRKGEAQAAWEAALQIDPTSKVAMDGLSKCLISDGNYEAAISLLSSTPRDEAMTIDLAVAYSEDGKPDDAAAELKQALATNQDSLGLTNGLITIYVNQNRYQEAAQLAEKMAKAHPESLGALAVYLRVLILNDDVAKARPLGEEMLTKAPHAFDSLYLNGVLKRKEGDYPAAKSFLDRALKLDSRHYNCHYNLGVVLEKLNDYSGAKKELEQAIEMGGSEPQIRFELVTVLRRLGETEKAQAQLKIYQAQLQERANRTVAATKSAQAGQEISKGNTQKAVDLYREAAAATPQDALLNYKLALALDRAGDTDGERAALKKAVEIDPGMAVAQNQLGYLASVRGDLASAEKYFRLAIHAAPGYTQAWISLAATLGMESRFPEAQEAVGIALRLDPKNESALQLRHDLTAGQQQH